MIFGPGPESEGEVKCNECGNYHPDSISYCPVCKRTKIWNSEKRDKFVFATFPPRTIDVLREIENNGGHESAKITAKNIFTNPERPRGLFIHGKVGTGKTILASAILLELARLDFIFNGHIVIPGETHIYAKVSKLLSSIRRTFGGNQEQLVKYPDAEDILSLYCKCRLLVLDDIGVEKGSEWVFETLYSLIDDRCDNNRPTIYTSNISIGDLSRVMNDDRVPSRINGTCVVFEVDGNDRRTGD